MIVNYKQTILEPSFQNVLSYSYSNTIFHLLPSVGKKSVCIPSYFFKIPVYSNLFQHFIFMNNPKLISKPICD